ncbi:peroxisomal multifunctional enzyme type 2 [Chondromyces apiculatus]|uniref:Putative short-chain dehydrogenase n=1 Tax=Chondromyces apiculatus DSM 436 TaxID=1192034 RepID=A0A017TIR3_9BACT|nr:peroxisomal multifunctional enzyme type 2 [Chondromyces apiculatus]EYF08740.1 putative short-chain dehydrogenase [Chondromyces apiculatus DSM 436]
MRGSTREELMANELRFDGRVAIVTGAGGGLGRAHALLLASRGAKVVVNDLGGSMHGGGKNSAAADRVVEEIKAAGGEAAANYDSVEEGGRIVQAALDHFGRIDIVINNAGILRDVTFHKMTEEDWDLIYRVHVLGAFRVTHAAWPHLRDQGYGRIIMTASAAGIYGNFGQSNYGMAKLGLVGFANTLALEGQKRNVLVNTIAPLAGSRLTETVLPKEMIEALKPEFVSPLCAYLVHESSTENGGLFEVGGGFFAKLRWERTEGTTLRLGRPFTLEQIASRWDEITSFEKSTHPPTITASMQPVMNNLEAGPSKGGNDLIDVDLALGYEYPSLTSSYDERDLSLYALGVGAAADPLDDKDLRYVYELHRDGFLALPTFGVIPAMGALVEQYKQGTKAPGLNYGFERILHGEQYTEIRRPLPPHAKLTHRMRVKEIFDKGKNAVVITEVRSTDETGEELLYNEYASVVRGAGGWGGGRGPSAEVNTPPERAPDATITEKIGPNQALLYRLSGDVNPLHADPSFAENFGFPRPILHGLCTFGYAARHVLRALDIDPRLFKSIKVRFSDSVFPGETLITEMWKESATKVVFRAKVQERDKVVLSAAAIELYTEIPKPKAKAQAVSAAAVVPAAAQGGGSEDVFIAIHDYLEHNPESVAKTATVFQIKLASPESTWTLDFKNGKGAVVQGTTDAKPDVTLELSDADFIGMATGKLDPMKLYSGGQLKISGNIMASQKLGFLKKIDPEQAKAAVAAHRARKGGGAATTTGAAVVPAAAQGGGSEDVFIAIRDYLERNPESVAKTATVFQIKLASPESTWTLDFKNGKGAVAQGTTDAKPDVTLELSDADFIGMATGKLDPMKLYSGGQLKISGNIMASQKLGFLKKIDPEQAKAAVAAHRQRQAQSGATTTAAPAAAGAQSAAPAASTQVKDVLDQLQGVLGGRAKDINAIVQLKLTSPDQAWVLDFAEGRAELRPGEAKDAAATLTLAGEELVALVRGESPLSSLFQRGKVRVDGDVRVAKRLGLLEGLLAANAGKQS